VDSSAGQGAQMMDSFSTRTQQGLLTWVKQGGDAGRREVYPRRRGNVAAEGGALWRQETRSQGF
jgi:hypothetical protein